MGGMSIEEKKKLQVMLKRIQGQVGGIERMVGDDKKCEAVVTQIVASMSSLKNVAKTLLADAVTDCTKEEYTKLLKRFL
jgi:CsoR family transcriptional regulator, copper-sensing transcriptional repressor